MGHTAPLSSAVRQGWGDSLSQCCSVSRVGGTFGSGVLCASSARACRCSDHYSDNLLGYANSIRTADGGTHMEGFRAAITRVCNTAARKLKLLRVSRGKTPCPTSVDSSCIG